MVIDSGDGSTVQNNEDTLAKIKLKSQPSIVAPFAQYLEVNYAQKVY
jgi:hypothetical protein